MLLFSGDSQQEAPHQGGGPPPVSPAGGQQQSGERPKKGKAPRLPPPPGYSARTVTVWTPEQYAQQVAEAQQSRPGQTARQTQQQQQRQQQPQPGPPGGSSAQVLLGHCAQCADCHVDVTHRAGLPWSNLLGLSLEPLTVLWLFAIHGLELWPITPVKVLSYTWQDRKVISNVMNHFGV